ncbi:MAG: molybdenum cofactor biosynthesis protein MoaE [Methanobrevibacter sp.]|jgi:molybdopterin synthase catalytic subunit|nr:molybdenum cofactor biosynthesis protein MoaE [Candidatus Methanovirga basalitermitum]
MLVKIVEKDDENYRINDLVDELKKNSKIDETGAIFTFEGFLRGKEVKNMMLTTPNKVETEKKLIKMVKDVEKDHNVYEIATVHYIGKFYTGDTLFLLAVLGSHREETLKAMEDAIEKIKYGLEFKKEEVSDDGTKIILAGG